MRTFRNHWMDVAVGHVSAMSVAVLVNRWHLIPDCAVDTDSLAFLEQAPVITGRLPLSKFRPNQPVTISIAGWHFTMAVRQGGNNV